MECTAEGAVEFSARALASAGFTRDKPPASLFAAVAPQDRDVVRRPIQAPRAEGRRGSVLVGLEKSGEPTLFLFLRHGTASVCFAVFSTIRSPLLRSRLHERGPTQQGRSRCVARCGTGRLELEVVSRVIDEMGKAVAQRFKPHVAVSLSARSFQDESFVGRLFERAGRRPGRKQSA